MIWKDTYRLGVEPMDKQHFLLFQMVEKLLHSFRLKQTLKQKNEHIASFKFMKNYIDKHFSAEEAYMESIQYSDLSNHRAEHQNFCRMIAYYEKLFQETDYSIKSVKEFAGLLVSWLTYHVCSSGHRQHGRHLSIRCRKGCWRSYASCWSGGAMKREA